MQCVGIKKSRYTSGSNFSSRIKKCYLRFLFEANINVNDISISVRTPGPFTEATKLESDVAML